MVSPSPLLLRRSRRPSQTNDDYAAPGLGDNYSAFGYNHSYNDYNRNHYGGSYYNDRNEADRYDNSDSDIGALIALGLLGALAGALNNNGYAETGYGWNNGYGSGYGSGYGHSDYGARAALEACERKAEQVNWNRGGNGFEWTQVYDIDQLRNATYRVEARGVSKYRGPDYYVDVRCRVDNGRVTRFNANPA